MSPDPENYKICIDSQQLREYRCKSLTIEEILIYVMRNGYGMPVNEIGEILSVTPQTVRAVYIRAGVKENQN